MIVAIAASAAFKGAPATRPATAMRSHSIAMALSGPEQLQAMNIARNLLGSQTLPQCTVVVAGGNGRVGASVCRNLLRNHPLVSVRALIRNADDIMSYEYLSYEVGAEDAKGTIRPAWAALADGEPRISFEFDEEVQGTYGLDRLSLCECELRYKPDVERALQGADAVIYCASAFDANRRKNPERLQARAILAQFWRNSGAILAQFPLTSSRPPRPAERGGPRGGRRHGLLRAAAARLRADRRGREGRGEGAAGGVQGRDRRRRGRRDRRRGVGGGARAEGAPRHADGRRGGQPRAARRSRAAGAAVGRAGAWTRLLTRMA